ncbi:retrotransposon protein, putative, ty1-copia subclass [Tanacetum coccineum]
MDASLFINYEHSGPRVPAGDFSHDKGGAPANYQPVSNSLVHVAISTDVVEMALPVQNINHSAFRSMFEKEKLSGNNFNDWFARLKLVLRVEKKMHVIEQPLPPAPEPVAEPDIVAQWTTLYDAHTEIACLMLGSMTPDLHRQFKLHYLYDMIQELRSMFEKQAGVEKFDLIQSFHACKQEEGKPVADYVLKMKGYVEKLERLGYVLPQDITVGLILNGLTKDFVGFVRNYNMHNMGKTIGEIHAMLIEYEKGLPKKAETPQVMMIKGGKIQKANKKSLNAKGQNKVKGKGKDKKVYIPKPKNPKPTAMERPAKDDACHHCKEVGHWKRNCPVYLAELLKKKKQVGSASSSGIFTIELFSFPNNNSWVYDTGCGTHICITKQGFRIERKLKQGALYLYVGNGVRAQVEAIGSFDLVLPNGLVICLDNCHYAPTITRGVVSVSRLVDNGFVQCFTDYGISVSKNDVLYFNAIARNGIYEIDMHDLVPNVNSIYNVSNKRVKILGRYLSMALTDLAHITRNVLSAATKMGALVKRYTPEKLQQRSIKYIFIGYLKETMGYYFYFPPENKIVVARYAEFFEKNLTTQEVSGRAIDLKEIQDEDTSPSENTSKIPMEVEEAEKHSLGDLNEPTSYKDAMLDPESKNWLDAMNAEMQSMIDNKVWVLVDLPLNCKTVGSKWIFKKKTDMDGIIHTYKARLVAKGYTQLYEVDYEETFSPVADIRAIRIIYSGFL